jgi:CHASE2 domain-containing sensor protein
MDAQSAATIKRWPWSRAHYAAVVDALRRAGAAAIVFDVDFSSASDAKGDTAFAAALARADGMVALPTFGQSADATDQRTIDALPLAMFRSQAALASVSIQPDPDGQVRSMPFGTMTDGVPRPSLSSYIAQRSGVVDVGFPIDMSIDPATIPRLSFIDVRDGNADLARVRGRSVLIGATAVEMGDRYATPSWGVIPGVVVQAMAAETLLRGIPRYGSGAMPFLLALLTLLGIVRTRGTGLFVAVLGAGIVVTGVVLFAQHVVLVTYPLAAALSMIAVAGLACAGRDVAGRFRAQRMIDETTGLPNGLSLVAEHRGDAMCTLVVLQLVNYDSLVAILGSRASADIASRSSHRATEFTVRRTGSLRSCCRRTSPSRTRSTGCAPWCCKRSKWSAARSMSRPCWAWRWGPRPRSNACWPTRRWPRRTRCRAGVSGGAAWPTMAISSARSR